MRNVGCVPYVNARPLVHFLEREGSPISITYDTPNRLAEQLRAGTLDAALVSSWMALNEPGWRAADGVGIVSNGPVESVRLFSKVPIRDIQTLALDPASLTSNCLAQVILAKTYDVNPNCRNAGETLDAMLAECDACVLIGDKGMEADETGLEVIDLGLEWKRLTGLPFIWALWIGGDRVDSELAFWLSAGAKMSGYLECPTCPSEELLSNRLGRTGSTLAELRAERRLEIAAAASDQSGWPAKQVEDYLTNSILFEVGPAEWDGLREFQKQIRELGLGDALGFPEIIKPEVPKRIKSALGEA